VHGRLERAQRLPESLAGSAPIPNETPRSIGGAFLVRAPTLDRHGDGRVRTDDIQLAKLALYQLSYIPEPIREPSWIQIKLQLL